MKNRDDLTHGAWFKSSYSNGQSACVEVARGGGAVWFRDSKDTARPAIHSSQAAFSSFIAAVGRGEFDKT
ncbi:DUF397 domain-containing protein [Streptomyces sparsogenes]|uniref:DUF397 domain-containing protein n=1 Tax=Streptomyces sparsogenes TaxID=67365 RepID=UPI0033C606C1